MGGKLTEYRYMAEDVFAGAVALRGLSAADCRNRNLLRVGAPANPVATLRSPTEPRRQTSSPGRAADRTRGGGNRRHPSEFEYAVTHEGAMTAEDILDRRTRIGETDRARAVDGRGVPGPRGLATRRLG